MYVEVHTTIVCTTGEPGELAALPVLKPLLYYSWTTSTDTDTAPRRWAIQRCGRGFSLSLEIVFDLI